MKILGLDFALTLNLLVSIIVLPTLLFNIWQVKRSLRKGAQAEAKADEIQEDTLEQRLSDLEEGKQDKSNCITEALRVSNLEQRIAEIHREIKDDLERGEESFKALNCELVKQGKQLAQVMATTDFIKRAIENKVHIKEMVNM